MLSHRKRADDTGDEVQPWQMTYGDMVTLLLVFFVFLSIYATFDVQRFREVIMSVKGTLGVLPAGVGIFDPGDLPQASPDSGEPAPAQTLTQAVPETFKKTEESDIEKIGDEESLLGEREEGTPKKGSKEKRLEEKSNEIYTYLTERGRVVMIPDVVEFDTHRYKVKDEYRFSISSNFQNDLNNRRVPNKLRREFKKRRILFSDDVSVENSRWVITNQVSYIVKKENNELNIYDGRNKLFGIELKFQELLNNEGKIRSALLRQFEDHNILLPNNVNISIKDRSWLIANKLVAYIVKKENDKLNIYDDRGEFLFGINAEKFQSELNREGKISSKTLRQEFEDRNILLYNNAMISNSRWLIDNKLSSAYYYSVRKEDGKLKVYESNRFKGFLKKLESLFQFYSNQEILIVGHADESILITNNYPRNNWELSSARAIAVAEFLTEELDIPKYRLAIQSCGEYKRGQRLVDIIFRDKSEYKRSVGFE